jgi:hypothetical protein
MQPMELGGQVEVVEPEGWDRSTDLSVAFAVNLVLPLPPGQSYSWCLEIDEKDVASAAFYVRSSPPGPASRV